MFVPRFSDISVEVLMSYTLCFMFCITIYWPHVVQDIVFINSRDHFRSYMLHCLWTPSSRSPSPTVISSQHIRWLQTLSSFLLKVPSAPQLKHDKTNPLLKDLMEWGCCSGCLYHNNQYFLVVCERLIVYVNLVVSAVISEHVLAIFVPDTILVRYFFKCATRNNLQFRPLVPNLSLQK
jgi:hypothetical protein